MAKKELTDAEKSGFPENWGGSEFDAGESGLLPHTPFQNNPDVADQVRGDPRIDGPYIEDIRNAQAAAAREVKDSEAKKFVDEKRKESEAKLASTSNVTEKKKGSAKENKTGSGGVDASNVIHPTVAPVKASAKVPVGKATDKVTGKPAK